MAPAAQHHHSQSPLRSRRLMLLCIVVLTVMAVIVGGALRTYIISVVRREKQVAELEVVLRERLALVERRESRIALIEDSGGEQNRSPAVSAVSSMSAEGSPGVAKPTSSRAPSIPCRSGHRLFAGAQSSTECSGHGVCNRTRGYCRCSAGFAGTDCAIPMAIKPQSARPPKDTSPPDGNKRFTARDVAASVTVIVPFVHDLGPAGFIAAGSASAARCDACRWLTDLLQSIGRWYPGIRVLVVAANGAAAASVGAALLPLQDRLGVTLAGDGGGATVQCSAGAKSAAVSFAAAWNCGLARVSPGAPTVLLSPEVMEFHEHTNLELMLTSLLTTDVDVLGFMSLSPVPSDQWRSKREEYLLETPCWDLHHRRWMMWHSRPAFGYRRHEGVVQYCDGRASNSFMLRGPPPTPAASSLGKSDARVAPLFNESMGELAIAAFYAALHERNRATIATARASSDESTRELALLSPTRLPGYVLLGVCSECLLKASTPFSALDQARGSGGSFVPRQRGGAAVLVPQPINERHTAAFAERFQVELFVPPWAAHPALSGTQAAVAGFGSPGGQAALFASSGPTLGAAGLQCVKSGGIYGHSNRGLYAPLCHRLQRQRDFLFLAKLWTNASNFNNARSAAGKHYGVSLHHGNLFGALRIGTELLWETDGDFDMISFDDTHEELLARWERFKAHATARGFEVRTTYPEKPWYCSFLRDKTDFQLNARSILDPRTRGKPPQIHNVSVLYQGMRVYVNGFQNPWQGIRSDPGHDYRDMYLAQQGWVLHFTNASIRCGVPGHNACLPDCNAPHHVLDHNYCHPEPAETLSRPQSARPLPVIAELGDGVPDILVNPILWFSREERDRWADPR